MSRAIAGAVGQSANTAQAEDPIWTPGPIEEVEARSEEGGFVNNAIIAINGGHRMRGFSG